MLPFQRNLQPAHWTRPRGYANGIAAEGFHVAIAGQIGWSAQGRFETDDLAGQVRQALVNVLEVLTEAGGRAEHIVRMTWYLVDKREYLARAKDIGAAYRDVMVASTGEVHFPAMSAVQVVALMEDRAKVEIECTAVVPLPENRGGA